MYDQNCIVAVQCPRCREKRRYRPSEIWKHKITTESKTSGAGYFITEPLFIQFGKEVG